VIVGDAIIYALGAAAIAGAAVVVFGRNLFHNVLAFTVMLVATAGLFGVMGSEFLAVVQVFVYIGGVVVLLIFGLMMTASEPGRPVTITSSRSFVAMAGGLGLAALALSLAGWVGQAVGTAGRAGAGAAGAPDSVVSLGAALLTDHAAAFEVVGVILLVAALSAILIVRRGEPE
jgi:NADH:ubiquinone oxidoreductase subunit 6 (subunit J)